MTDKDTLDYLDGQKTVKTYKTMQLVDGKLYPPMAARVEGKYEDASELGAWEMAVERPDLVKDGKFKLDKGKGQGNVIAAYNPICIHPILLSTISSVGRIRAATLLR